MTVKYEVVPATREHAIELAKNMREADKREAWAIAHLSPEEATLCVVQESCNAQAGLANGEVVCLFGIEQDPENENIGVPWLLTSHSIEKYAWEFLHRSISWMKEAKQRYSILRNRVDTRNKVSIRWLRWLGFDIKDTKPFGVDRMPFHIFEMKS